MIAAPQRLLCVDRWLKGLDRLVSRLHFPVSTNHRAAGIIIIKLAGMGSILRFLSLCENHRVEKSSFRLITFSENREVCDWMGLKHVIYIRTGNLRHFVSDCLNARKSLTNEPPECIIDLERASHAVSLFRQWLAWTCRSRTISFGLFPSASELHQRYDVHLYTFHRMMVQALEMLPKRKGLRKIGLPREKDPSKIIVNINASNYLLARRYPLSFFLQTILKIHEALPESEFLFTGIQSESEYVNQIVTRLADAGVSAHSVAGAWSLAGLADELSTARLFITGDSGPLHLAIHLGTPTAAIWGPTQPNQFGYTDSPNLLNLTRALPCSPCLTHPYSPVTLACQGRISCMTEFLPAHAAKMILEWLTRSPLPAYVTR